MRYILRLAVEIDTAQEKQRTAEWIAEQIITYAKSWLTTKVIHSELVAVSDPREADDAKGE